MKNLRDYKGTVYKIIGAAMTVHRELSWGLMEGVYQEALHLELLDCGIENEMAKQINCYYKNRIVCDKILKAFMRMMRYEVCRTLESPLS